MCGKIEFITLASRGEPLVSKNINEMLNYTRDKFLNLKLKIILGFASISKSSEKMGLIQRGDIKSANNYLLSYNTHRPSSS